MKSKFKPDVSFFGCLSTNPLLTISVTAKNKRIATTKLIRAFSEHNSTFDKNKLHVIDQTELKRHYTYYSS